MSIDTRLEKLARILRKAAPSYGPDDYNPDDDESAFTPEFEVEDESASDLEETPDIEDGGLRPGMTTEERIKRIKERNEALEEDRLLNPMPVEKEFRRIGMLSRSYYCGKIYSVNINYSKPYD